MTSLQFCTVKNGDLDDLTTTQDLTDYINDFE